MIMAAVPAAAGPQSDPPPTAPAAPAARPEPFTFADFTWLTGNPRTKESPLDTKLFTAEARVDVNYTHSFNRPRDDTVVGSSEVFRSGEFQVTQLGVGGVSCGGGTAASPSQFFLGFMAYHRAWFDHDRYAVTLGGGAITNPGRYLVLLPPINGATAASGTPYFTENPGDAYTAWDASATVDYMPSQFITFRGEFNHRAADVPYFAGAGGVTPPGGNSGAAGSLVAGWAPDLQKIENRFTLALLVKF
jgi:hypothetical protein